MDLPKDIILSQTQNFLIANEIKINLYSKLTILSNPNGTGFPLKVFKGDNINNMIEEHIKSC